MDLILDTCAILSLSGLADMRLSPPSLDAIQSAHRVYVSSCSMFEVAIKHKKKNLNLGAFNSAKQFWDKVLSEYQLTSLPITDDVFYRSVMLPDHHSDPFDRIIVAQAMKSTIPVVTFDQLIALYDVTVMG